MTDALEVHEVTAGPETVASPDWKETVKTNFVFSRPFWWMLFSNAFSYALIWHIINRDSDKLAVSVIWASQASGFLAALYWVARDQAKRILEAIATLIEGWRKQP